MEKKLKQVLPLLNLELLDGELPENVNDLCNIMSYISGQECEPRYLRIFVFRLSLKNPAWYSNAVALLKANADMDTVIRLNKCSLKQRSDKQSTVSKKEPRKPFHVNIPVSIYAELTNPLINRLKAFRLEEKQKGGKK